MPATIKDIAAKLGVSHTTVSRALRGHPHVDEDLRRRVQDAARELNYRPNALARGLKDMHTRVVGLIITDLMNDFSAEAATIIQSELAREGYRLLFCVSGDDPSSELAYLHAMREERIEGLILVPSSGHNADTIAEYAEEGVPIVQFIRTANSRLDSVVMDDFGGALAMTEHLLALGHTRIAVVLGQAELSTAGGRLRGFLNAHANAGVPVDDLLVKTGRLSRASGRAAVDELIRLPSPPSAVFATSSVLLLGALHSLQEHGVRVPEDLSLAGFGDPEWCAAWRPPITTVGLPVGQMAKAAVQALLQRIAERSSGAKSERALSRFGCRLIVRASAVAPTRTSNATIS